MKPDDDPNAAGLPDQAAADAGSQEASGEPDASFFDLILETDLANIIKKSQSGQPLTKREREMIEEERTKRTQKAALPTFKLEGEGSPLDRMTQRELAEVWGYSLRQVKNWIADGRAAGDPAPVTRPDDMPGWFKRVYAPRECPEKLRAAVQRIQGGEFGAKRANASAGGPAPATITPRIEVPDEEKGLLAMLDRYRTAEVTLHNKYMAAVDAGDESRSQFLLSEWSKMGEKVRALEKAAPKALEELRIYVKRDEIQRELETLHNAVLKGFRQEFRLARIKLKSAKTAEEWGAAVDETVEKVSMMLVDTEFAEPLELQVA
jgi:hypothetical protein